MSWDVYLCGAGPIDRHEDGGTYVLGGTEEPSLNVTYNYGPRFREAWPEPIEGSNALSQMLDGRRAGDTIAQLGTAVEVLGMEPSEDYWDPSPGNAGRALARLLTWARQYPDATWEVM